MKLKKQLVWIGISTAHIAMGLAYLESQDSIIMTTDSVRDRMSGCWPENVRFISLRTRNVVLLLMSAIAKRSAMIIWVPHLHPALINKLFLKAFEILYSLDVVKFYDDGFSYICRKTMMHRLGYIKPNEPSLTWDFVNATSQVCASIQNLNLSTTCEPIQPCVLVLSSANIDVMRCVEVAEALAETYAIPIFYVPHLNYKKDSPELVERYDLIRPNSIEFDLLPRLTHNHHIVSGLTSSVMFLHGLATNGIAECGSVNMRIIHSGSKAAEIESIENYFCSVNRLFNFDIQVNKDNVGGS